MKVSSVSISLIAAAGLAGVGIAPACALHLKPTDQTKIGLVKAAAKIEAKVQSQSQAQTQASVTAESQSQSAAAQAAAAKAQGKWASSVLLNKLNSFQNLGTAESFLQASANELEFQQGMLLQEGSSVHETSHAIATARAEAGAGAKASAGAGEHAEHMHGSSHGNKAKGLAAWLHMLTIGFLLKGACIMSNICGQFAPLPEIITVENAKTTGKKDALPYVAIACTGAQWCFYGFFAYLYTGNHGFLVVVYANIIGA
jgi:hypothetical protein